MTDPRELVPAFTGHVEPEAGGGRASEDLGAFAVEHGVADGVRARLAGVAADVVERLVAAGRTAEPIMVEADIDQGSIQVVFTRALGSREAVEAAWASLRPLATSCDAFSVRRGGHGSTVEVWVCFTLG
jgi:hypothetical protein